MDHIYHNVKAKNNTTTEKKGEGYSPSANLQYK